MHAPTGTYFEAPHFFDGADAPLIFIHDRFPLDLLDDLLARGIIHLDPADLPPRPGSWKAAERAVAEVLMRYWDPIGVSDVPEAQDEYDSYVPEFIALLARGATGEEISNALYRIETEAMGLDGSPIEALQLVARKLREAYPKFALRRLHGR